MASTAAFASAARDRDGISVSPSLARLPFLLAGIGGLGALIGMLVPGLQKQFCFSWLMAFMFYLSLMLGGLFLVILHHLFDAQWSVPIRRITEHLGCSAPIIAVFFLPILGNALLAGPEKAIFQWMHVDPAHDHALSAKASLFNKPAWVLVSLAVLTVWFLLTTALRKASLDQDKTGSVDCTRRLRFLSALGIFLFAITLTLGAILWMKSLQWQWFSTMYGVYYFAGSVWLTLATVYVIALYLKKLGPLTFHDNGKLFFAFTVFYAYIAFSQYFLIWNANIPEETFWYVLREKGSWWSVGMLMIFGHFFLPFLLLLRIDTKMSFTVMVPLAIWAWLMHFCDLSFNIMPVLHPDGFVIHWLDVACMAFMGGVMALWFIRNFNAHPPFPQRDPRMAECLGIHIPPSGGSKSHGGAH